MSEIDNILSNKLQWHIEAGDAFEVLRRLPDACIQTCVTSPPYFGLRDYGIDGQIGHEETHELYISRLVEVFREVRRVLRKDGTLWLNLGDSYARKNLIGIPWRVAFALQTDGWFLRSDIIWYKPNAMPESVKDRPTSSHEHIFLMSKSPHYYYNGGAIQEPSVGQTERDVTGPGYWAPGQTPQRGNRHDKQSGHGRRYKGFNERWKSYSFARSVNESPPPGKANQHRNEREKVEYKFVRNKRDVWSISTHPFKDAHFATFPPDLVEPCVLAGCPEQGMVLDPFCGSGTVGMVALRLGRKFLGIDLNPSYVQMSKRRIIEDAPLLNQEKDTIEIEGKEAST